ncbi:hypothetical protein GWK47_004888 [Chionoecetes opilio]|uniref:Uncharacterized protein n=1 Tax=Chionoecetes opilio TaxID=41210 RepID=A0A8J4YJ46_CHIOP|nr:hypothetical protein GWK47_004888 [Chionoecetes opilio]
MESLHESVDLPAINVRLHHMASQVWLRMQEERLGAVFWSCRTHATRPRIVFPRVVPRSLRALRETPIPPHTLDQQVTHSLGDQAIITVRRVTLHEEINVYIKCDQYAVVPRQSPISGRDRSSSNPRYFGADGA